MMLRFLLSVLLLISSINGSATTLDGMRLSHSEADTRLVFDLSQHVKYKLFTLSNPERLVIDIDAIKPPSSFVVPNLTDTPIRNIRYAVWDRNSLRVVLDLEKKLQFDSQMLTPSSSAPHRLVIDLYDASVIRTSQKTADQLPDNTPATTANTEELSPSPHPIKTQAKIFKQRRDIVVAIDAGHGGQDSGALGKRGTKEKDVVLAIARQLASLVNNEPGMRAYLTRDSDVFLSLRQRIKRARQQKADMFISIHADAFHDHRAKGASVFVLSERGASSEAAQLLADKENAADLAGGISLEDKDDLLASVLLDLSQTASLEASLEVANTVLSGLKRVGHVHKKHVESAAFVVLKSPDIPSLLVETAFISNPDEERKLKSTDHQKKLARAMLSGIRNYFQRNPLPDTNLPQQHIVNSGDTLSTIAQRYQVSLNQLKSNNALKSNHLNVGDVLTIP